MWQQKGLEVGYTPFLFVRRRLWSRTKFQASLRPPLHIPRSVLPCPPLFRAREPQTRARAHTDLPFLAGLKPFPRFYILDEIPVALCQFITFADQMMSLDILRRSFIVVFYAGRTAPVKRIRAKRSRLIGYRVEIRSPSRSLSRR